MDCGTRRRGLMPAHPLSHVRLYTPAVTNDDGSVDDIKAHASETFRRKSLTFGQWREPGSKGSRDGV